MKPKFPLNTILGSSLYCRGAWGYPLVRFVCDYIFSTFIYTPMYPKKISTLICLDYARKYGVISLFYLCFLRLQLKPDFSLIFICNLEALPSPQRSPLFWLCRNGSRLLFINPQAYSLVLWSSKKS